MLKLFYFSEHINNKSAKDKNMPFFLKDVQDKDCGGKVMEGRLWKGECGRKIEENRLRQKDCGRKIVK